jgi:hypothetical protein
MKARIVGLLTIIALAGSASAASADTISVTQAGPTAIIGGAYVLNADTCCDGLITGISSNVFTDVTLTDALFPNPAILPVNVVAGRRMFFTPNATIISFNSGTFGSTSYGTGQVTASGHMMIESQIIVVPFVAPGRTGEATAPFTMHGSLALFTTTGTELFNGSIFGSGTFAAGFESQLVNGAPSMKLVSERFTFAGATPTPEPAATALLALGLAAFGARRSRSR